jgi:hypothetical protein
MITIFFLHFDIQQVFDLILNFLVSEVERMNFKQNSKFCTVFFVFELERKVSFE